VLSTQQSALRRTLSNSSISSFLPSSIIHKMESSGGSSVTGSASSSESSYSSVIGRFYIHHIPVQSTTNPTKAIKKYGLFQFQEDATTTPQHVSSPLNLTPSTCPLSKFKENLPKFSGNNIVTTNKHLVAFSNAFHNIGGNDNDTCMCLFVNSLEGKAAVDFFDLPPKIFSTWEELIYWFKSTIGRSYKNIITSPIRMVRPSSLSTCVSLSYTIRSMNSFDLKTKPLPCITTMNYLPPTIIGLRKNPLIILVLLCILGQRMKNSLKEQVFPRENQ
jgi:hypothetical protein